MNLCATGLTATRVVWHSKPLIALVDNQNRAGGKRVIYDSKVSRVLAEPLPVESDHVFDALSQAGTGISISNSERLYDGRLIPKFALAHEFAPALLVKKSSRNRSKNRNHAKPFTK